MIIVPFIVPCLNDHCRVGSKSFVIASADFVHDPRSSIAMASEPAAKQQKVKCISSASSTRSHANEVVYVCYACKKEIPQRYLRIIDFDAGPNPMFIKPFHFDCVPIYYRDRDDIEEERQEDV